MFRTKMLLVLLLGLAEHKLLLGLVMGLLLGCTVSQVRGLLASLRTTTILLLEAEVLRERVGGFALGVDASGATVACCSTRGALRR